MSGTTTPTTLSSLSNNPRVKKAVEATSIVDPPGVSYISPANLTDTGKALVAIGKQGNTILHFLTQATDQTALSAQLTKILEELESLKTEVKALKEICQTFGNKEDKLGTEIDDLTKKFGELAIKKKEPKGKLKVFRDPYEILKKEQEKLKKKD